MSLTVVFLFQKFMGPNVNKYFYRREPPVGDKKNCYGVDLNRNFGTTGFGIGASTRTCSEVYWVLLVYF